MSLPIIKYRLYIEDIDYNISVKEKLVNLINNKMIDNIICYGGNGMW